MSLLAEPEETSSSSGRWILLVAVLVLGAGAAFLFGPRWVGSDEVSDTTEGAAETRAAPASSAAPPAEAEPEPRPGYLAPKPNARPRSTRSAPAETLPAMALLRVTSDVDGADVFIDRRFVGKTPFESSDISPGPHRVNVSAPGYDGFSETVEIGEVPATLDLTFKTVHLDQRIAVVHKHELGACEGQLVATIDGIHYQTDDDDAFVADLDALEEFSVDYLEHNLRLKVRGGRTYDFTDSEPNADKLFVFHREVDRVRDRRRTDGSE